VGMGYAAEALTPVISRIWYKSLATRNGRQSAAVGKRARREARWQGYQRSRDNRRYHQAFHPRSIKIRANNALEINQI